MEARVGNSILDFETLFTDFKELLNGSCLRVGRPGFCVTWVVLVVGHISPSSVYVGGHCKLQEIMWLPGIRVVSVRQSSLS